MAIELNKRYEIHLRGPHAPNLHPELACDLLASVEGVLEAGEAGGGRIWVRYDLGAVTAAELESVLQEVGFHLDASLIAKLKRALQAYVDDTHRSNLTPGQRQGSARTRAFVKSYEKRPRGCRDPYPEHWRGYR